MSKWTKEKHKEAKQLLEDAAFILDKSDNPYQVLMWDALEEIERLKNITHLAIAQCGINDAADACRKVIATLSDGEYSREIKLDIRGEQGFVKYKDALVKIESQGVLIADLTKDKESLLLEIGEVYEGWEAEKTENRELTEELINAMPDEPDE